MNEAETDEWLDSFQKAVENAGLQWFPPHVTTGPFKKEYITCEWWVGTYNLTAFLSEEEGTELIKVWGHRIDTEMESIPVNDVEKLIAAWRWLLGV